MPTERLRGTDPAVANDPYAGVPSAEYFLLLDKNLALTGGARTRFDPDVPDDADASEIPTLIFERGEIIPQHFVTGETWERVRIAALDESLERIDRPGGQERADAVDAPGTIAEFRERKGMKQQPVWACQEPGCDETYQEQDALAEHREEAHADATDAPETEGSE